MISVAQHLGAEIFVTVGSPPKRDAVERLGVAADHILNSRSLSFAPGIMEATKGRGVDVIINTLAGEALRVTMTCLAPFGHLVNLRLKDASSGSVELEEVSHNISYTSVDIPVSSCV
jgi:NADPH:quinone reductase-like Zn-dependent oxidoreductase